MKTIEEIIGANIRARRDEMGMTQRSLGKICHLTVQTLGRIEKGKRSGRKANLEAIANALGCTREDLLKDPEEKRPTVEGLIEVIAGLEKENKKLRELHLIIKMIEKKYSPKEMSALAHAKDLNLQVIKAVITGNSSNIKKMLAELIAKRKSLHIVKEEDPE